MRLGRFGMGGLCFALGCAHVASRAVPEGRAAPVGPSTTVKAVIRAPISDVFAFAVAQDVLPKVLKRYGPVPAIVGTQVLHGPWETVGADRRVFIDGGGSLHEQITHFERPEYFAYQINDFQRTMLRGLARRAVGSWIFTDLGGSTGIEWTYSFEPTTAVLRPVDSLFVQTFYRGYMTQCLDLMKAHFEGAPPS
jgi:hypothetical protein